MIFAFFLELSHHMWDDENTPARFWGMPPRYTPENGIDEATWDKMIDFLAERKYTTVVVDVGDGVRLDSHPEIAAPDAWSRDKLKAKLDVIRARGMEPIPKLNFSACHHTWLKMYRHMLSTPQYYEVCADIIGEVCELFGSPRLFHLGMDEENYANQTYRDMVQIRGEKLWWHDFYYLCGECEKHGARPWIWSDYYWDHPDLFVKYMPKSVLQSNWYYGYFRDIEPGSRADTAMQTYIRLNELGYDQVPTCSTWSNGLNTEQTLRWAKAYIAPEHLEGFLTASWFHTAAEDEYALKSDALRLFNARKKVYPETL